MAAAAIAGAALFAPAQAQTTLRIAMTASDIPATVGQPDQGFEGNRFTGWTMYDALVMWDLSDPSKATALIPGLATSWKVDDADKTKWIFTLRPGVKFHDGSDFDADAVVWNVNKVLDKAAPHFDARQVGVTLSRMPTLTAGLLLSDQPHQPLHGQPRAVGEGRQELGEVRGRGQRHRPLEDDPLRPARAAGAGPQHRLLEQGPRAEDRADGAAAHS
jgi:hypothetical protein